MRAAARIAALGLLGAVAAVPPTAAWSQNFLCFFGPGAAELSPRSQAVVHQFAAWWHRARRGESRWPPHGPVPARTMPVEVHGHADAAEAAAGKASVGRVRAEAVADFLRLNGLPADLITVVPHGAERPMVPVAGAEPQNRRAELIAR